MICNRCGGSDRGYILPGLATSSHVLGKITLTLVFRTLASKKREMAPGYLT